MVNCKVPLQGNILICIGDSGISETQNTLSLRGPLVRAVAISTVVKSASLIRLCPYQPFGRHYCQIFQINCAITGKVCLQAALARK